MGAITPDERATVRARSPVGGKYDTAINRESAYEILNRRADEAAAAAPEAKSRQGNGGRAAPEAPAPAPASRSRLDEFLWGTKRRQGAVEAAAKSATRTVASGIGRQILRGVLGSIFGGKR
jgi:hypothetical protein